MTPTLITDDADIFSRHSNRGGTNELTKALNRLADREAAQRVDKAEAKCNTIPEKKTGDERATTALNTYSSTTTEYVNEDDKRLLTVDGASRNLIHFHFLVWVDELKFKDTPEDSAHDLQCNMKLSEVPRGASIAADLFGGIALSLSQCWAKSLIAVRSKLQEALLLSLKMYKSRPGDPNEVIHWTLKLAVFDPGSASAVAGIWQQTLSRFH
ncbi:hypothetical protein J7T55_011344 [Diaporthe amygdali]|uniref:uncharacterized protein n=1 Tax=Phomopsis amygdali TaxID=1214568 RepID=UPI0022FDB4EB|nr:uncharacterized protein J7T55_011344 [Diaporthe amygdali]KAJ0108850.1 hypothetical protein J7T55_011344 [Diaporthe amygdali]